LGLFFFSLIKETASAISDEEQIKFPSVEYENTNKMKGNPLQNYRALKFASFPFIGKAVEGKF